MGMFANLFTWWNGASLGTTIVTRFRGEQVGRDDAGNIYYRHRDNEDRRWVIYNGSNDSSRVPPAWNAWLRGTIDDVPEKVMPPRRPFQKDPRPNLTGTPDAYRPRGSLLNTGERAAATGDYEAWKPE
ncbi:NADH:ubiquinone oxidoreductase subunit NDUFA12 [Sphingomicrobium lutaoense]|uniref:NADH:ubiquinone oxidoreductase subunit n=1 Tax=Sphingomicrobium lutaoense TaxID=515949 RepID=A0A839Z677_9SPHN|nr:NADH:ubiquinone oxidoreductase subunit NDUFA12 [Sphingomicrobium lutaoense]MBB3764214.1 NADH:ubiquinone oxidoreductase subunit [Sphingomicrobium lutaoense]